MARFRSRHHETSTGTAVAGVLLGAVAGFAVGMFVAQRMGGFSGLAAHFRSRMSPGNGRDRDDVDVAEAADVADDFSDDTDSIVEYDEDEDTDEAWTDSVAEGTDGAPLLEERVLEAFNNDPVLAERAIDIGAVGSGIIELTGWVDDEREVEHAMTIAHGVPGVDTVVNRLMVDDEADEADDLHDAASADEDEASLSD